jgi:hypothetical protein
MPMPGPFDLVHLPEQAVHVEGGGRHPVPARVLVLQELAHQLRLRRLRKRPARDLRVWRIIFYYIAGIVLTQNIPF